MVWAGLVIGPVLCTLPDCYRCGLPRQNLIPSAGRPTYAAVARGSAGVHEMEGYGAPGAGGYSGSRWARQ